MRRMAVVVVVVEVVDGSGSLKHSLRQKHFGKFHGRVPYSSLLSGLTVQDFDRGAYGVPTATRSNFVSTHIYTYLYFLDRKGHASTPPTHTHIYRNIDLWSYMG